MALSNWNGLKIASKGNTLIIHGHLKSILNSVGSERNKYITKLYSSGIVHNNLY